MAKKKGADDKVAVFGIDLTVFNRRQQAFLINSRYAKTEAACRRESGVHKSTVTLWKRETPGFRAALLRVRALGIQADAQAAEKPQISVAREKALDIMADAAPAAAQEVSALVQKGWDGLTDRGKSTKLKACEIVLKTVKVESKHLTDSGKINVFSLIQEILSEAAEAGEEAVKEAGKVIDVPAEVN